MISRRTRPLFALSVAFVIPACGQHGGEASSSSKSPIVLGTPDVAHPEAALVDLYQGGQLQASCSGTVIAPYVVLTAGHCADGYDGWQVTAPLADGQSASSSNAVMLDWAGNGDAVTPSAHDVALIILASPITLAAYPTLATAPVPDGTPIVNVGRVQDDVLSTTSLYDGMPLLAYDATSWGWPLDYITMDAIQSGDSGGADYWMSANGPVIVAVNSAATTKNQYELLARVDLVAGWIQDQIARVPLGLPLAPSDAGDAGADVATAATDGP